MHPDFPEGLPEFYKRFLDPFVQLTVEPVCLRDDRVPVERSDPVSHHPVCGADRCVFTGAVLAGRAAPVGEPEDLPGVT